MILHFPQVDCCFLVVLPTCLLAFKIPYMYYFIFWMDITVRLVRS